MLRRIIFERILFKQLSLKKMMLEQFKSNKITATVSEKKRRTEKLKSQHTDKQNSYTLYTSPSPRDRQKYRMHT